MKLNRKEFPPLSIEDFYCEYYLTHETKEAIDELVRNVPLEYWPKRLRPKFIDDWQRKKRAAAKRNS